MEKKIIALAISVGLIAGLCSSRLKQCKMKMWDYGGSYEKCCGMFHLSCS